MGAAEHHRDIIVAEGVTQILLLEGDIGRWQIIVDVFFPLFAFIPELLLWDIGEHLVLVTLTECQILYVLLKKRLEGVEDEIRNGGVVANRDDIRFTTLLNSYYKFIDSLFFSLLHRLKAAFTLTPIITGIFLNSFRLSNIRFIILSKRDICCQ